MCEVQVSQEHEGLTGTSTVFVCLYTCRHCLVLCRLCVQIDAGTNVLVNGEGCGTNVMVNGEGCGTNNHVGMLREIYLQSIELDRK